VRFRSGVQQFDRSQLRITKVALALLFALVGLSLVFAMSGDAARVRMGTWLAPTPDAVWREGKVWTLLTGPFLQIKIFSLLFEGLMVWLLLPALERWWGPRRFGLFVGLTAVAGTVAGSLAGLGLGEGAPTIGLGPTLFAGAIAFGILYARQPVQFFGVLPMTGRQFMFGMIAISALFVLVGQEWQTGAALAAAMLVSAGLASGRLDPIATWRRWRFARARAHLSVVPPEISTRPKRTKTDERYLN
jgi:membrane associated rhomboid family serine protease